MSYGLDEIYNELTGSTEITSLVNDISKGLLPADLGTNSSTINIYLSAPINTTLPFNQANYSINCRALKENTADNIANKVIEVLNRKIGNRYFLTFTKLPNIRPTSETDNFNSPLECVIRNC